MTPDQEETARLIMMEMRDKDERSIIRFSQKMALEHPKQLNLNDVAKVWQKYMGIDRLLPTHNLDTGERLR